MWGELLGRKRQEGIVGKQVQSPLCMPSARLAALPFPRGTPPFPAPAAPGAAVSRLPSPSKPASAPREPGRQDLGSPSSRTPARGGSSRRALPGGGGALTSLRSSTPSLASCSSDTNLVVSSPRLFSCRLGAPAAPLPPPGGWGPHSAICPPPAPAPPRFRFRGRGARWDFRGRGLGGGGSMAAP